MKIFTSIVRILFGAFLIFVSFAYFFKFGKMPIITGDYKTFNDGVAASKYLLPLAKVVELLVGISFVSGRYVALANIVLLPITINILLIHIFLDQAGIPITAVLLIANIFLIYKYWNCYRALMVAKYKL